MGAEKREDIRWPLSSQEILKLNNILTWLWSKLHGDINFSDVKSDVRNQMFTYPLQFQGEDNLDSSHPHYVWFYVPEDVSKIKKASLNAIVSRYRMDSSVAVSDGQAINISGSISTSNYSFPAQTYPVEKWGLDPVRQVPAPGRALSMDDFATIYWNYIVTDETPTDLGDFGAGAFSMKLNGYPSWYTDGSTTLDLYDFNHVHKVTLPPHSHDSSFSGTAAGHQHNLNEGIKESTIAAQNVKIYVNNALVQTLGDNGTATNIDILSHVLTGQWNVIEINTTSLARITIYGIIELLQKVNANSLY